MLRKKISPSRIEIHSRPVFALILLLACAKQPTPSGAGQTTNSEHFNFYFTANDQKNQTQIVQHLETSYERVKADLRVTSLPKINVHFYATFNVFRAAIGMPNAPSWVVGIATSATELHLMSPSSPALNRALDEMLAIAVHEFTHCVTLHIEPRIANNPRWLWEGIALFEAGQFVNPRRLAYMIEGHPPTLAELNANWQTNSQVYDLGYLLVEYIVEKWGRQQVVDLIKSLGDVSSVLGISVSEFEKGWYEFVKGKYL